MKEKVIHIFVLFYICLGGPVFVRSNETDRFVVLGIIFILNTYVLIKILICLPIDNFLIIKVLLVEEEVD